MFVVETRSIFHSPIARTSFQGGSKNKTAQLFVLFYFIYF